MNNKKDTLYLIDGSSFLYRFFFAIKNLSCNGFSTGSIYGFARMLLEIDKENPKYIVVFFDTKAKTFRSNILESYKANRPKMPDELSSQIVHIKELIKSFGINIIEKDGFEADDLMATFADKMKNDFQVLVVTSDKDLFQIVDKDVFTYDPVKKIKYGEKEVYKKLGIYPEQVADYLALIGDSIDNIPGIKSIGPKTAVKLLTEYKNCENILQNIDKLKPKIAEAIQNDGNLMLYKQLTSVDKNVCVEINIDSIRRTKKDIKKIKEIFIKFNFISLLKELSKEEKQRNIEIVNLEAFLKNNPNDTIFLYKENHQLFAFCRNKKSKIDEDSFEEIKQKYKHISVYGLKDILHNLHNIPNSVFDINLACYLINSDSKGDINKCFTAVDYAEHTKINSLNLFEEKLESADDTLKNLIKTSDMHSLLYDVETPLSFVLYRMEQKGVKIDIKYLSKFRNELEEKEKILIDKIQSLAGEKFNINSTKELQRILFEKLKIKPVKKTKTGYSTDFESLKILSADYEIAQFIIEYRTIAKVISTYIVPFLEKADKNSRLHTTFNQTLTSTGRLSSSNPNLQNLPAADDEIHSGIRKSIIAEDGYSLICADYSQIELRVLAEMSKDEALLDIFKKGEDIHTQTAVKLFSVHPVMVDHNLRRMAKVINFGILYGMGYVSLSKTLNIPRQKAKEIISTYFERFKRVKDFIDTTIESATEKGYAETYFKRRRYFTNIKSANQRLAEFEKRAAVNAVIQGTAADIIKIAMVNLDKKLQGFDADIVMQVHDELLIESKTKIAGNIFEIVKDTMENSVKFSIPLTVNIKTADNWLEAK